ncbi:MAG TPA: protein kinase, partial [Opitutaceae bacterium]
ADTAMGIISRAKPGTPVPILFREIFSAANKAVFDAAVVRTGTGKMATTLTISVLRDNVLWVAHVGDSRVYLIRSGKIRRLTEDHCYVAMSVKFRLMHEHSAMTDPKRSLLTRSVGHDPSVRFDSARETLQAGDIIVQCCDGLYAFVTDEEIADIAAHFPPDEACKRLVALAERRQVDDNISVQIVCVQETDSIFFLRGTPIYLDKNQSTLSNDVKDGDILDDRFKIETLINRSGMASIFKAVDRTNNQKVAIKVPHMQFESDVATFNRFKREEEIGLTLNHPFILKVVPGPASKSRPYLAMEFLEGQTLDKLMEAVKPLPEKDAAKIASQICEALQHMHAQGVVHRDLKPQNIMICSDGTLRILDFGIAKSARMRRLTFAGFSPTMGTPDYMAPEQVNGRRGDHRTDIYSLGAILYEMVTGKVPFEGESPYAVMNLRTSGDPIAPRKLNDKLTPVIEEIILHALARDPEKRFESAERMKAELDDYEIVELVERFKHLEPIRPWRGKFRLLPYIIFFIILQFLLFGGMFWYFTTHGKH